MSTRKDGISLIEVLISIMLISVVIASIFQIQKNNLNFLEKSKTSIKNSEYISLVALTKQDGLINKDLYLNNEIKFDDDEIRKELKTIKINVKDKELDTLNFDDDKYSISIKTIETTYKIDNKTQKQFYRFTLDN